MHALVLAAGDGDRLRELTNGTPKSLLLLDGRPIIEHVLTSLYEAGVRDATVVVGYQRARMRRALEHCYPDDMTLRVIENSGYMRGNARSIWAARKALADTRGFVLAMSDHVVDPGLTRALVAEAGDRCRLAVELTDAWDGRADEATRALVDDRGRVVALGKNIGVWNALDTGVFWCTPAIFDALQPPLRDGEAGAVFAELAAIGELDAIDVTGHAWIDIDTPEDFRDAELLVRKMRVSSASEPPTMAS